jgi:hypothetical protein
MWINKFGFIAINQKSPKDITEGILFTVEFLINSIERAFGINLSSILFAINLNYSWRLFPISAHLTWYDVGMVVVKRNQKNDECEISFTDGTSQREM